jgi:hypothetical protein
MAAHASDWGNSLNQHHRNGKLYTMVMMFGGGVVSVLDGIPVLRPTTKSTATKNTRQTLAILITMQMWWCDAGHVARWSTSRTSLEATGCRHRLSACTPLPNLLKQHKTLSKHNNFYLATTVHFDR